MLESFTCATFRAHLNDEFTVRVDDATSLVMELVEATESSVDPGVEARRAPFSVIFRGPGHVVLPQRIYGFEHPEMGTFDLFVVPVGKDADGVQYEAVFA